MYEKILVALDGSEPSQHALKHAITLADKFDSALTLLAVAPEVKFPVFPDDEFGTVSIATAEDIARQQETMKNIYQKVLEEAESRVRSENPQIKIETVLKEGRPSATVVDVAENDDFDLIVIGSRGIGGITGWILGSTSRRVVDSCTKPILIVK